MSVIEPLLPSKVSDVPRVDDRPVLKGIFWRLRTGAPWADILSRHGAHTTSMYTASTAGARQVTGWEAVSAAYEGDVQMIDRSSIRVHQHGDRKGSRLHGSFGSGLTIDIHALADAIGLKIVLKLTAGQTHDGRRAADMIEFRVADTVRFE